MMKRTSLLILALGLGACDRSDSTNAADNAAAPANAAAGSEAAATTQAVVLEGGGLRLAQGGAARTLTFGTARAQAIEAVTQALGGPPTSQGVNEECGQGPVADATWEGNLILSFQEDRFVGWESRGSLVTANGIRVGSTRAELDAAFDPEIEESTLGTEFSVAGGLGGLLESAAPNARITHLSAGSVCVFR